MKILKKILGDLTLCLVCSFCFLTYFHFYMFAGRQHFDYIRRVHDQTTSDGNKLLRDVAGRRRLAGRNICHAHSRSLPLYGYKHRPGDETLFFFVINSLLYIII